MSQAAAQIYTGVWINWSHGALLGSTLTLSASHGGLLTAFLAIFVSAAGTACWSVTSFAVHQYRAKLEYQDALHHQQQLIFRSNPPPGIAFWQFSQLIYYWQSLAKNPLRRTLPLAILALLNLVLFALAGVFSSEVAKAPGNEALIRSQNCGSMSLSNTSLMLEQSTYSSKILNDSMNAAAYARACYMDSHNPLLCNQYAKQQISWKIDRNASCPFGENLCLLGSHAALGLDTGLISSHDVLGINAPPKDRVNYRKVTTCSPISMKAHYTLWNDTDPTHIAFRDQFVRFWLGEIDGVTNYTMQYNMHSLADSIGYSLISLMKLSNSTTNSWKPIAPLDREDADISLFLLSSNSIYYLNPVSDPFFSANQKVVVPINYTSQGNVNMTWYQPDDYVNALACIDQHQFCNPNNDRCTPLTASDATRIATASLGLNARQRAFTNRMTLLLFNIFYSVTGRGESALRASESKFDKSQVSLPNDQWMLEVNSWFAVAMARLQQAVVQYATGPPYIPEGATLLRPLTQAEITMCKSQRVRSPGGTLSFSILGMAIILTVGSALIITSLCLERIVRFMRRRFAFKEYKRLQWTLDGKFQLHRLAYEQAGQGTWAGGADDIPTTRRGDLLRIPYLQDDEGHPRLRNDYRHDSTSGMMGATEQLMAGQKTPLFAVEAVDVEARSF